MAVRGALAALVALLAAPGCLDAPSPPGGQGGAGDGGPDNEEEIDDPCGDERALGGDLLHLRFEGDPEITDETTDVRLVRDSSGARRDAAGFNVGLGPSFAPMHGEAAVLDGEGDVIFVAEPASVADDGRFTFEAWVRPDAVAGTMVLFGDLAMDAVIQSELTVALQDGLPVLLSNADGAPVTLSAEPAAALTAGAWAHVAVSWDGRVVRFYRDGEPAGTAELDEDEVDPLDRRYRIGVSLDPIATGWLRGAIDEVKLSSCPKTAAQIARSMAEPSAGAVCGDGVVEGPEECELAAGPCCTDSCELASAGDNCPTGTCNGGGVCVPDAPSTPSGSLVARYEFNEEGGATAADSSGSALHLTLKNAELSGGRLHLGSTSVVQSEPATPLRDQCAASSAITIEVRLDGPSPQAAPLVSFGPAQRPLFLLAQYGNRYIGTVLSAHSAPHAAPVVYGTPTDGDGTDYVQHIVLTRDSSGERALYVDGLLVDRNQVGGSLGQAWGTDPAPALRIGGLEGLPVPWQGNIDHLSIYCTGWTAEEVASSYAAWVATDGR